MNKEGTHKKLNKNLISEDEKQFINSIEQANKYQKDHPEAMFWYFFQCGKIKDLTREDFIKINKYVREEKKKDPCREIWEISEEEIDKYFESQEKSNFYTAKELSKELKVNIMTIYRYIKAGKIKAYRMGKEFRITKVEFNEFLNKVKIK